MIIRGDNDDSNYLYIDNEMVFLFFSSRNILNNYYYNWNKRCPVKNNTQKKAWKKVFGYSELFLKKSKLAGLWYIDHPMFKSLQSKYSIVRKNDFPLKPPTAKSMLPFLKKKFFFKAILNML